MKAVYSSKVFTTGGRNGKVESEDGLLKVDLSLPKSLGGSGKATNPEQLFAAGYAACFENAVLHVAAGEKVKIAESKVEAEVALYTLDDGRFNVGITLNLFLEGIEAAQAKDLIEKAHVVCPYSNATRGNIGISILHKGEKIV
ncbi:organic hydroperoxide resistance protein [Pseudobacteriovorax antillogorgiicola]|uniref:Peroxiredoxin, Ohr subfamily n=1 Tax=Pseudobacteriovorax antillogorgiicola TaxID=1513793 RepID=A0A1Y6CF11_9BACT|nr:organic hydroperoxide resistance protein [Pseudobacteriovorax antillogorgiicola]TCS47600.1 Ohr subfamily peroxiredoxin [Pseudobacteriovorax antillogorgiicola]SMF60142.1 peroxiredoxin, Ohr subfamily [Pseudobacteriovorax antillogorgiicola]